MQIVWRTLYILRVVHNYFFKQALIRRLIAQHRFLVIMTSEQQQ